VKAVVYLACAVAAWSCAPAADGAGPGGWREVPGVPGRGVSLVGEWRAANDKVCGSANRTRLGKSVS
jgi:hypothetical protein